MQIFIHCKTTLHVSGVTAPIIRNIKNCTRSLRYRLYYLYRRLRGQFLIFLMMGAVTSETCIVVLKWINICILLHLLDFYSHWIMMHGTTSLKNLYSVSLRESFLLLCRFHTFFNIPRTVVASTIDAGLGENCAVFMQSSFTDWVFYSASFFFVTQ